MADKFDLRRDIQFNSHVVSAVFDESSSRWEFRSRTGSGCVASFSSPRLESCPRYIPPFTGMDSFEGESYHTSRWPKEKVDFTARVAVIGTGATAVQLIPIVAKEVAISPCSSAPRTTVRHSGIH